MSAGELKLVPEDCSKPCGDIKGKCSFVITVDNNGKIEVGPSQQCQLDRGPQCSCHKMGHDNTGNDVRKPSRSSKPRIRIALLEEEPGSSDEEQEQSEDKRDMATIDAQSFGAFHDRFIKIYKKNLRGKPSFVVLEDALMRKRFEQTCRCHAQQQTSPCDIGAHTGSQTDEFLLQCAQRRNKGQSRGCQATEVNVELPGCRRCCAASRKSLHVPYMPRLTNPPTVTTAATEAAAKFDTAPRVTISFTSATASTVNAKLQQQQQQQLQATSSNQPTCCRHCCQQCNSNYCLPAADNNYACYCKSQMQQRQHPSMPQQQPQGLPATFGNCCSSCCMLRPSMAQTALDYGQPTFLPSHCSHHMLLTPQQQQQQHLPIPSWPPEALNHCLYYPLPDFGLPHCPSCHMQPHQCSYFNQHQQLQQHQQQEPHICLDDNNSPHGNYTHSPAKHPNKVQVKEQATQPKRRQQTDDQVELQASVSQVTVRRMNVPKASEKIARKVILQQARNKAGGINGASPSSKLYMARFGRTCLILKPTPTPMQPRLATKRISRYTSVMAWPHKMPRK